MSPFLAEITGTALLITLGGGVVANVVLDKTKGNNGGLIAITFGWAVAVFTGVYATAAASGGHLNPAVTIGLAVEGSFDWALVPSYILAQFIGAMLGAVIVWLSYRQHFDDTQDANAKLAVFCTAPAIRSAIHNIITELVGTFVLVLGALLLAKPEMKLGALDALPIALLVLGIGLSLGGPTGYAINPARDLGPRIVHALLPIKNKRDSDWSYAWVPVVGPIAGGVLAALVFKLVLR
ncbi:MIP/aquaporin family protein [Agriterribacter sp.]|uniref:MIP/aquaporin family protein n=1 Tax=Agriterribacter sp. TaxID=2821509 RepID=UPI002B546167|nr:MIP/aquaporin family protein [Agriterribacter sp.]HRO44327.1 MIP/aquaporin family protein [Agriterribacter sp.]HRQ16643.1 MIP/aquaporin family protein [Agriterribacter sp.]